MSANRSEQAVVVLRLRLFHGSAEFRFGEVRIRVIDIDAFGSEERRHLLHELIGHAGAVADSAGNGLFEKFRAFEERRHALLLPRRN